MTYKEKPDQMKIGDRVFVKSETTKDKTYMIIMNKNGLHCTCPDSVLRNHDCKHTRKFKRKMENGV